MNHAARLAVGVIGLAGGGYAVNNIFFSSSPKAAPAAAPAASAPAAPSDPDLIRPPVASAVSIQGRRSHMEDRWVSRVDPKSGISYFAVFDGHGGHRASDYCAANLHANLFSSAGFHAGADHAKPLVASFHKTDEDFLLLARNNRWLDGSTVVVAIVDGEKVIVANAGDSRAVLARNGVGHPLSDDHKPSRPDEEARLNALGAWQVRDRIFGRLNLSRGIGDSAYKNPLDRSKYWVVSTPELKTAHLERGDQIVLASDGLWDVLSNEDVARLVKGLPAVEAAKVLVEEAVRRESGDNITALVVSADELVFKKAKM